MLNPLIIVSCCCCITYQYHCPTPDHRTLLVIEVNLYYLELPKAQHNIQFQPSSVVVLSCRACTILPFLTLILSLNNWISRYLQNKFCEILARTFWKSILFAVLILLKYSTDLMSLYVAFVHWGKSIDPDTEPEGPFECVISSDVPMNIVVDSQIVIWCFRLVFHFCPFSQWKYVVWGIIGNSDFVATEDESHVGTKTTTRTQEGSSNTQSP